MLEEQLKQKLDEIKDEVTQLRRDVDALALAPWTTRSDDDEYPKRACLRPV